MRRFSRSHEWIELKGKTGIVGITDYAQKELGEIVYVQLPKVGQSVNAGQEVCVLESTKAAADVYSPVSGKIVLVNEALAKEPQQINQSGAWLFQIELSDLKEYDSLLSEADYKKLISG